MGDDFDQRMDRTGDERSPYTKPRSISSIDECYFYHTMDVPGYGTVRGEWDLRGSFDKYLGHFAFEGKRVLDIGAASGILSFHIERQGAEVVSFDLSEKIDWDIVPFHENDNDAARRKRRGHIHKGCIPPRKRTRHAELVSASIVPYAPDVGDG